MDAKKIKKLQQHLTNIANLSTSLTFLITVLGLGSLISLLYTKFQNIWENISKISLIEKALFIFLILLIFICIYYGFVQDLKQKIFKKNDEILTKPNLKRYSRISLFFLVVLLGAYLWKGIGINRYENETIILVSNLESKSAGDDQAATQRMMKALDKLDDYKGIKIITSDLVFKDRKTARSKGKEQGASIVIWGYYTNQHNDYSTEYNFETIKLPKINTLFKESINTIAYYPTQEFLTQSLRLELPNQVSDLTLLTKTIVDITNNQNMKSLEKIKSTIDDLNSPKSKEFLLTYLGYLEIFDGRFKDSYTTFEESLKYNQNSINIRVQMSLALALQGEYESSIKYLDDLILWFKNNKLELKPDDSCICHLHSARGYVYFLANKYDNALKDFDIALNINKNYIDALFFKSITEFELGYNYIYNYPNINILDDSFFNFQNFDLLNFTGQYLHSYIKARNLFLVESLGKAKTEINKSILNNPKFPKSYYLRGLIYYREMDFKNAYNDFISTIELNHNYSEAYTMLSNIYNSYEMPNRAIENSNISINSIKINPNSKSYRLNSESYRSRAFAYYLLGKYNLGLIDINEALSLNPYSLDNLNTLALIYSAQNNNNLAVQTFEKAIQLDKKYPYTYLNLGFHYMNHSDNDNALANFKLATSVAPRLSISYQYLGDLNLKISNFFAAEKFYKDAIGFNPVNSEHRIKLGNLFFKINNYQSALNEVDRAIKLNKHIPSYYISRSYILRHLARQKEGIIDINKAIEIDPKLATAYCARATLQIDIAKHENKKILHEIFLDRQKADQISGDKNFCYFDN
jgi:tetratricopeptide (TPR) repeat protein